MNNGTKFLVMREEVCPTCGGDCFVYNPIWEGANRAWDLAYAEATDKGQEVQVDAASEAMDSYWIENGYNPRKPPPEEEPCGTCFGLGVFRREVDLTEALAELGLIVQKTGGSHG